MLHISFSIGVLFLQWISYFYWFCLFELQLIVLKHTRNFLHFKYRLMFSLKYLLLIFLSSFMLRRQKGLPMRIFSCYSAIIFRINRDWNTRRRLTCLRKRQIFIFRLLYVSTVFMWFFHHFTLNFLKRILSSFIVALRRFRRITPCKLFHRRR